MSRLALQRVMVRMLYDPEFAARVLHDPAGAVPEGTLSGEEQTWLLRPDPRAWRTDPERPLRSLTVLLQEYPASSALAVAASQDAQPLRRFFASDLFHRVIQERGSMALAFGQFLVAETARGALGDSRIAPMALLERRIAELRRTRASADPSDTPSDPPRFYLSAEKALHKAEAGTADLHDEILSILEDTSADAGLACAVLDLKQPLPANPIDPTRAEPLLLELILDDGPRAKAPVGIAEVTSELHSILNFALTARLRGELEAEAERLGADPEDAGPIVNELIAEGVLLHASR